MKVVKGALTFISHGENWNHKVPRPVSTISFVKGATDEISLLRAQRTSIIAKIFVATLVAIFRISWKNPAPYLNNERN